MSMMLLLNKTDLAKITLHDLEQVHLFEDFLRTVGQLGSEGYRERLAIWVAVDPGFRSQWLGLPVPPLEPAAPA